MLNKMNKVLEQLEEEQIRAEELEGMLTICHEAMMSKNNDKYYCNAIAGMAKLMEQHKENLYKILEESIQIKSQIKMEN